MSATADTRKGSRPSCARECRCCAESAQRHLAAGESSHVNVPVSRPREGRRGLVRPATAPPHNEWCALGRLSGMLSPGWSGRDGMTEAGYLLELMDRSPVLCFVKDR